MTSIDEIEDDIYGTEGDGNIIGTLDIKKVKQAEEILNFFKGDEETLNKLGDKLKRYVRGYDLETKTSELKRSIAYLLQNNEDWLYKKLGTEYVRQLIDPEMIFYFEQWHSINVTKKIFGFFKSEYYESLYKELRSKYDEQKNAQDDTYSIEFSKKNTIFNLKELILWILIYQKEMMKEVDPSYIKNEYRGHYFWFLFEDEAERDESGNIRKLSDLEETAAAASSSSSYSTPPRGRPKKRSKYGGTAYLSSRPEESLKNWGEKEEVSPFKFHNDSATANADDGKTGTSPVSDKSAASKLYNILLRF